MVFVLPYCHSVDTYSQNEVNEQQTAFDAIKIELRNSFKVTKTPTKPHLKWHYRQRANMPSLQRKTHCYWQVCWKIVAIIEMKLNGISILKITNEFPVDPKITSFNYFPSYTTDCTPNTTQMIQYTPWRIR